MCSVYIKLHLATYSSSSEYNLVTKNLKCLPVVQCFYVVQHIQNTGDTPCLSRATIHAFLEMMKQKK